MSSFDIAAAGDASSLASPEFKYDPLTEPESEIRLLRILPLYQPSKPANVSRFPKNNTTAIRATRTIKYLVPNSPRKHYNGEIEEENDLSGVRCEIFHVTVDRAPPYKALSYTWGSHNDPRVLIKLNQQSFWVRENLWLALQQLHAQPTPTIIWIDALCINQTDELERNEQVTKMKTIYENAEEVLVWLGPSYEDSHLAFQFMQEMHDHRDDVEWIARRFEQPELRPSVVAFRLLISREYWWRMWIVQELTVAKTISLRCGTDSISAVALDETQKLLGAMTNRKMGFQDDHLFKLLTDDSLIRWGVLFRGLRDVRTFQQALAPAPGSQGLSFFQCLLHNATREASDPRDMVYGLAALANSTSKYQINIDYSLSVADIYIDLATKEILHCKTLEILTGARSGSRLVGLPSWVPDWSRHLEGHIPLYDITTPQYSFSASGKITCDVSVSDVGDALFLKGVVIGTVEIIGERPGMADRHDLDNAGRVFLKWWDSLGASGDRGNQMQEQFGRTLICDMPTDQELGSWNRDEFCRLIVGRFVAFCYEILPSEDIDSELVSTHSWLMRKEGHNGAHFDERERRIESMLWIQHSTNLIWDRRFFLGSSNIMGLAPNDVQEGDIICVPLGCPQPMIFRKVDGHYTVIGEAYVDGYMRGKAVEMLERGELELETFELH